MYKLVAWPRSAWSIFDEMEALQSDMAREFPQAGYGRRTVYPRMNIWTSVEGITVDAEIPGVDPKEVEISLQGDELTLKGTLREESLGENGICHRRERPVGEFSRTLKLPFRAEADGVKASCRNGVLRVTAPRCKEEMARKIKVEAA